MIELEIFELLKKHKWTVSFAESCTGGMLSSHLTSVSGTSAVFKGAIVSYSSEIKTKHLNVDPKLLQSKGPFNKETALQMAQGVKFQMDTDWSMATTGILSPLPNHKTGTVYFAILGPKRFVKTTCKTFSGLRDEIRRQSVLKALHFFKESMQSFI